MSLKFTYIISMQAKMQSSLSFRRSQPRFAGTFLQSITPNAALAYKVRYGNSTDCESGVLDLCDAFIDSINQPRHRHGRSCSSMKGFGLGMMSF